MKKFLLPETGNYYKANLHCHTNISDGNLTPEEMKKAYMAHGYSIIAYTDHDVFIPHPELCDENFLALNSMEIEITQPVSETKCPDAPYAKTYAKTCHLCFIALDPDNDISPLYHREKYVWGNGKAYRPVLKFDESKPDFEREYTHEGINRAIKEAKDCGFFVTYNHPVWSLENYNDYTNYHGMHAMEICNYSSFSHGWDDYNEREYDDMLMNGERLYCVSADDNHNFHPFDSPKNDSFGGFTMIKAESLDYRKITDALVKGDFYASQGPHIYDLWLGDGMVHVTCSGAKMIKMNTGRRKSPVALAIDGELLTHASFPVAPEDDYIRITVKDANGNHANTRAYFTDEILEV